MAKQTTRKRINNKVGHWKRGGNLSTPALFIVAVAFAAISTYLLFDTFAVGDRFAINMKASKFSSNCHQFCGGTPFTETSTSYDAKRNQTSYSLPSSKRLQLRTYYSTYRPTPPSGAVEGWQYRVCFWGKPNGVSSARLYVGTRAGASETLRNAQYLTFSGSDYTPNCTTWSFESLFGTNLRPEYVYTSASGNMKISSMQIVVRYNINAAKLPKTATNASNAWYPCLDGEASQQVGYHQGRAYNLWICKYAGVEVNSTILLNWGKMYEDAAAAGITLRRSGDRGDFRTNEQQWYLYNCYRYKNCNNGNEAAYPGWSDHQMGFAIDFDGIRKQESMSNPTYAWLVNNAHKYGFVVYPNEHWHWYIPQTN